MKYTFPFKKIIACLVVLLFQMAGMLTFTGCKASGLSGEMEDGITSDTVQKDSDLLSPDGGVNNPAQQFEADHGYLECRFADLVLEEALARSASADKKYAQASAVLLPHYGNAMGICCDLLSSIERDVELVVLVGPNHEGSGDTVQVSGADWYWNAGEMTGDSDAAQELASVAAGTLSDIQIAQEWSVQTLIPYIHRYFPSARLVTVLLSRGTSADVLSALAQAIGELAGKQEVLLVGSVDFSHYLDPESARENDQLTCRLLEAEDYTRLLTLDNGYLDSPETAVAVLYYVQSLGQTLKQCGRVFEQFWENGQKKAGSYYTFAAWQEP